MNLISKYLMSCLLAAGLAGCSTTARPVTEDGPSFDGLMPVENTSLSRVWVREGYTLAPYRQVMLVGAGIQYRPVKTPRRTGLSSGSDTEFPLSEQQRRDLEALITAEFDKALDRLEMAQTDTPGPDVLKVRGMIMDVVSRVPPNTAGSRDYWLDSVGQATFVIELIDSESGAVLIRGVDTRAAQTPGYTYQSNSVTNAAEARRLFARWANMLVDALNDLQSLEPETAPE